MPATSALPLQKNVIEEIMRWGPWGENESELEHIFLEVDQVLYHKVIQVLFNARDNGSKWYNMLIVQMGRFDVIIRIMWVISSRFHDSGLVELLVEASIRCDGSKKSSMKGSNIKFVVRRYKILFETILCFKFEYLMDNILIKWIIGLTIASFGVQKEEPWKFCNNAKYQNGYAFTSTGIWHVWMQKIIFING